MIVRTTALIVLTAAVSWATDGPGQPSLRQVIDRLGQNVTACGDRLSVIVGVEHYDQEVSETGARRSLVSEIAFIPAGSDWLTYRDVFEVDGRRIADRTDRLQSLLLDSPGTAFEQGRRIAEESARYNLGDIQRNFNTPTMCLFVMKPQNLARFRFKKAGEEQEGGRTLWKIRYDERDRPTIVRSPDGRSLPMTGNLWVRVDDGAVTRTEMEIRGDVGAPVHAIVTVDYQRDERLDALLPAAMHEVYRGAPPGTGTDAVQTVECHARYSDFKRFETSIRLIIPK